jgi:hypothetical protein
VWLQRWVQAIQEAQIRSGLQRRKDYDSRLVYKMLSSKKKEMQGIKETIEPNLDKKTQIMHFNIYFIFFDLLIYNRK